MSVSANVHQMGVSDEIDTVKVKAFVEYSSENHRIPLGQDMVLTS